MNKKGKRRFHIDDISISRWTPSAAFIFFMPLALLFGVSIVIGIQSILREVRVQYQIPSIQQKSRDMARQMAVDILSPDKAAQIMELGAKTAILAREAGINYVTVTDDQGMPLYHSQEKEPPPDRVLSQKAGKQKTPFINETAHKNNFEYIVPVWQNNQFLGVLQVGYSQASLANIFSPIRQRIWLLALGVMLMAGLLLLLITSWLTRPFHAIIDDFKNLAEGNNLSHRIPEKGFGAIRVLLTAYNRLKDAMEDMRTAENLLGKYVSPRVAEMILEGRIDVVPQKKRITVLLVDIKGFTDYMASSEGSEEVTETVGELWKIVEECVQLYEGTIDKHVGDAVLCFWNAPLDQPDAARRAAQCLQRIEDRMIQWNQQRLERGKKALYFWASIATGNCVVGNMGHDRMEYTALGNAMNLAPRIMTKAHELEVDRIIDRNTNEKIQRVFHTRYLGAHRIRGFSTPIELYELLGEKTGIQMNPPIDTGDMKWDMNEKLQQ